MGGILARPSWLVRVSQVFKIFLPSFILARPFTNFTITLARSTGFPLGVLTSTVNVVISAAATTLTAIRIKPAINRKRFGILLLSQTRRGSGDVRQQELAWPARRRAHLFGGAIAAAHRALHRCRPAGPRPVAGQENVSSYGLGIRPHRFHAGPRGISGADLLDDVGALHLGFAQSRKEFRGLTQCQVDDFRARHLHQISRGAYHELQIPALALVEHPLNRAV